MLQPGLYEQVINNQLTSELAEIPEVRKAVVSIDKAEASKVLAQYLADVVQKGLDNVLDNGRDISAQIELTIRSWTSLKTRLKKLTLLRWMLTSVQSSFLLFCGRQIPADSRLAVRKTAADLRRPESSIAQNSLFIGSTHKPQLYAELKKEIVSAGRVGIYLRRKKCIIVLVCWKQNN